MIVVGGTYEERVTVPARDDVAGSGLRAAAALRSRDGVRLATALDSATAPAAQSAFATLSIDAAIAERDEPVGFRYSARSAARPDAWKTRRRTGER